jgi:hypothetical protein
MANLAAQMNTYDFVLFHFAKTSSTEVHETFARMLKWSSPWESFQISEVVVLALFDPTLKVMELINKGTRLEN